MMAATTECGHRTPFAARAERARHAALVSFDEDFASIIE
jgi:hypothetical protein